MALPIQAGSLAAAGVQLAPHEPVAPIARERAVRCLFFSILGACGVCFGLAETQHGSPAIYAAISAVSATLLAMVAILVRRARKVHAGELDGDYELRARRMFTAVNIIQWVSFCAALSILGLLHMPEYAATAVAMIVGLHLYPLADFLRDRQRYVTGTVLLLWALGCLLLLPRARVAGVTALGAGAVLMASAAWTLGTCLTHDASSGPAKLRA